MLVLSSSSACPQLVVILHRCGACAAVRLGTDKAELIIKLALSRFINISSVVTVSSLLRYFPIFLPASNMTFTTIGTDRESREMETGPPSRDPSPCRPSASEIASDAENLERGTYSLENLARGVTDVSSLDVSQPSEQLLSSAPSSSCISKNSTKHKRASKRARKRIREEREQQRREGEQ